MAPLEAGLVIDSRYALVARLDDRGLGETWTARDAKHRHRLLALKFLRALRPPAGELPQALADHLRALRALRHPTIVTTTEHGLWGDRPFLAQDHVEGHSLAAALHRARASHAPLARAHLERIFDQVCVGVEAAHRAPRAMVHGALTAGQVLVHRVPGNDLEVRLLDFGLAPYADAPAAGRHHPAGPKPHDLAAVAGPRGTDVVALALLLREMLVDVTAPDDAAAFHGRDDVPASVWKIVQHAILDPEAGFPTPGALRGAIERAWRDAVAPRPEARPPTPPAEVEGPTVPAPSRKPQPAAVWEPPAAQQEIEGLTVPAPSRKPPPAPHVGAPPSAPDAPTVPAPSRKPTAAAADPRPAEDPAEGLTVVRRDVREELAHAEDEAAEDAAPDAPPPSATPDPTPPAATTIRWSRKIVILGVLAGLTGF